MKDLKINSTSKTPEINFSISTGVFVVSGVSVPENSMEFYGNITDWLSLYAKNPLEKTKFIFKLSYVNTSSLQFIYDMLMVLDGINNELSKISVEWYYLDEDIDMKEMGEDFKEALSFHFSFYSEENV